MAIGFWQDNAVECRTFDNSKSGVDRIRWPLPSTGPLDGFRPKRDTASPRRFADAVSRFLPTLPRVVDANQMLTFAGSSTSRWGRPPSSSVNSCSHAIWGFLNTKSTIAYSETLQRPDECSTHSFRVSKLPLAKKAVGYWLLAFGFWQDKECRTFGATRRMLNALISSLPLANSQQPIANSPFGAPNDNGTD